MRRRRAAFYAPVGQQELLGDLAGDEPLLPIVELLAHAATKGEALSKADQDIEGEFLDRRSVTHRRR
jgi:hypothetical protein